MVVDDRYVDRHFLEEYTGYYATSLRPPGPTTQRIHFFSESFYLFKPPRWLAEIDADLKGATDRILRMIGRLSQ